MSNLYYPPFASGSPGDKLLFRASGTSTPQPTYADSDLTTPNSNPVVADAAGNFVPIYLDPSLPDYRVIRTSSADVTYPGYPVDGVPASSAQSQTYRLKGTAPTLIFEESDQATNQKKWRIRVDGGVFTIAIGDDAEATWTNLLAADRTNYIQATGTFTGVLTGGTGGTGTIIYQRIGNLVTLYAPNAVLCTSTSNVLTLTGLPAIINPIAAVWSLPVLMTNNDALGAMGLGSVNGSVVTFYKWDGASAPSATGFSASGQSKGLHAGWTLAYNIPQLFVG